MISWRVYMCGALLHGSAGAFSSVRGTLAFFYVRVFAAQWLLGAFTCVDAVARVFLLLRLWKLDDSEDGGE